MKRLLKSIGLISFILILSISLLPNNISLAENDLAVDGFNIIPELSDKELEEANEKVTRIGSGGGNVMKKYREAADSISTSQQLATGIMNRNTIMNYLVFVIQFLSQLGLVVGMIFIIYAGYKYMVSVFIAGKTQNSSATIKNAIIGIVIIIFSYAIMRTLTSFIGLT